MDKADRIRALKEAYPIFIIDTTKISVEDMMDGIDRVANTIQGRPMREGVGPLISTTGNPITIHEVGNGFVVKIGCQTYVAERLDHMMEEIKGYIRDPDMKYSEYERYRADRVHAMTDQEREEYFKEQAPSEEKKA